MQHQQLGWSNRGIAGGVDSRNFKDPARGIPIRQGAGQATIAGTGSAGSLIPPHEYHTIRNASDTDNAVSLHIYERPMTCCGIFDATGDGWHVYANKQLQLDHAA